jgi:hypothetical protein
MVVRFIASLTMFKWSVSAAFALIATRLRTLTFSSCATSADCLSGPSRSPSSLMRTPLLCGHRGPAAYLRDGGPVETGSKTTTG